MTPYIAHNNNSEGGHARGERSKRTRARKGRMHFERNPSQVIFDPASNRYVVTWAKCNLPKEDRISSQKDCKKWRPSISAVSSLFDMGMVDISYTMAAAGAISEAWKGGDRHLVDTDGAKNAAELVSSLFEMCVNPGDQDVLRDIRQALRLLADEIALVRLSSEPDVNFDESKVLPSLAKAAKECFAIDEFVTWPPQSQRRRFMYCLNKHERSRVAYTMISLLFDVGARPLLPLTSGRALRAMALEVSNLRNSFTEDAMNKFVSFALAKMQEAKRNGVSSLISNITQQQFSDCIVGAHSAQ